MLDQGTLTATMSPADFAIMRSVVRDLAAEAFQPDAEEAALQESRVRREVRSELGLGAGLLQGRAFGVQSRMLEADRDTNAQVLPSAETERLDCATSAPPTPDRPDLSRRLAPPPGPSACCGSSSGGARRASAEAAGGSAARWGFARIRTRQRSTRFGCDLAARSSLVFERKSMYGTIYIADTYHLYDLHL